MGLHEYRIFPQFMRSVGHERLNPQTYVPRGYYTFLEILLCQQVCCLCSSVGCLAVVYVGMFAVMFLGAGAFDQSQAIALA